MSVVLENSSPVACPKFWTGVKLKYVDGMANCNNTIFGISNGDLEFDLEVIGLQI